MSYEELFEAMAQSIIDGEPEEAEALAKQALAEGVDPLEATGDTRPASTSLASFSLRRSTSCPTWSWAARR